MYEDTKSGFELTDLPNPSNWVQLILSTLLCLLCGIVIMLMWNWFVVPLGLPAIGLIHALGLDMLVSFVITTSVPKITHFWDRWISAVLFALLTLLFGWVFHFFM